MTIYYFSYTKKAPSLRYRGKYLLEKIKKEKKINYHIFNPSYSHILIIILIYFSLLFKKNNKDIFIFQKICDNTFYAKILLGIISQVTNSIYDIDDAMYLSRNSSIIDSFIKTSKKIIVGSDNLKKYCLKMNNDVTLLTTSVPKSTITKNKKNSFFTVGWIGIYKVHKENLLNILFPVLDKIKSPLKLIMLGVNNEEKKEILKYFSNNKFVSINIITDVDWDNEKAINKHISTFDLGVMPLIDNELNKGKSAFKIKQYINCGVPALASPVGENVKHIQNGFNGFLCNSNKEWLNKITFFQNMPPTKFKTYIKNSLEYYNESSFGEKKAIKTFSKILKIK